MSTSPSVVKDNPPQEPVDPKDAGESTEDQGESKLPPEIEARLQSLERQAKEAENKAAFWHKVATEKSPEKPKSEAAEEPAVDADELVEAITGNDPKKFKQLLKKAGFVEAAEVQAMLQGYAQAIQGAQRLQAKFPELADPESEFAQAVGKHYKELEEDYKGIPSPKILELAVERAELEQLRRSPKEPAKPDPAERERRIAAQAGGGGQRKTVKTQEEPLTDLEKKRAAEYGLSEEKYRSYKVDLERRGLKQPGA